MAQRKRAGPITQRSVDRNHPLLRTNFSDPFEFIVDRSMWYDSKIPVGPVRESNPGPRAPEARIIPLDQQAIAVKLITKEPKYGSEQLNNGFS